MSKERKGEKKTYIRIKEGGDECLIDKFCKVFSAARLVYQEQNVMFCT